MNRMADAEQISSILLDWHVYTTLLVEDHLIGSVVLSVVCDIQ